MPDLTVTVPADKIPLVRDAVENQNSDTTMTDQEIIDWVEAYLTQTLIALCYGQQKGDYIALFDFDTPIP